jgi:hypothetical protein
VARFVSSCFLRGRYFRDWIKFESKKNHRSSVLRDSAIEFGRPFPGLRIFCVGFIPSRVEMLEGFLSTLLRYTYC